MSKEKQKSKKHYDDMVCTTIGAAIRPPLKLFPIPKDLRRALELYPKEHYGVCTPKCENYIKCLKSLAEVSGVDQEHYLFLFNLFLNVERHQIEINMSKNNLKNHEIQKLPEYGQFKIKVPHLNCDDPFINRDDTVILSQEGMTVKNNTVSKVIDISPTSITVYAFSARFIHAHNVNHRYKVHFAPSNWTMMCFQYALYRVNDFYLKSVIYPKVQPHYVEPKGDSFNWFNKAVGKNKLQKQAVVNILNRMAYPAPYILYGPPGTGKTATLVEVICQIWQSSKCVLICAPSNAAVDEITVRLIKQRIPSEDIYRLYAASKKWDSVKKDIRDCANYIDQETLFLPKDVVALKKIVIATLVTSIRLMTLRLRNNHFSYIIIDEAGQALEPEALIPLMLTREGEKDNSSRLTSQVVIAGDPHQLGPVVYSTLIKHLLGKSMLERLIEESAPYQKNENNEYNPRYITKLTDNFRSHPKILDVSNKLFYEGDLRACGGEKVNRAINWPHLPNKQFPLIFCSIDGEEQRAESNMSLYNSQEISVIMNYLEKLIGKKLGERLVTQNDIGIVTPYKEQHLKIKSELERRKWRNVTVGTVEIFQGQEKDIIILSTVRTDRLGFLVNPKRFNVAITRARSLLIVIGNNRILKRDPHWKELIQHCTENDAVIHHSSQTKYTKKNERLVQKFESAMRMEGMVPIDRLTEGMKKCIISEVKPEARVALKENDAAKVQSTIKDNHAIKVEGAAMGKNIVSIKDIWFGTDPNETGMKRTISTISVKREKEVISANMGNEVIPLTSMKRKEVLSSITTRMKDEVLSPTSIGKKEEIFETGMGKSKCYVM